MANNTLSTGVDNGGTQNATQSPQTSAPGFGGGTESQSVQPTAANTINTSGSTSGIPLAAQTLPTVNLASGATATAAATTAPAAPHKIQPVWAGFSIVLFLVALTLFWATMRSAKSTTNY